VRYSWRAVIQFVAFTVGI